MLPQAFLDRMNKMLGEEYGAFLDTFGEERYQALRLNSLKRNVEGKSAAEVYGLCSGGQEAQTCFARLSPVPWAENGYYYDSTDQPGKHPCHEAGIYYIQEPSAMAPAELLGVQPGDNYYIIRARGTDAEPGAKYHKATVKRPAAIGVYQLSGHINLLR